MQSIISEQGNVDRKYAIDNFRARKSDPWYAREHVRKGKVDLKYAIDNFGARKSGPKVCNRQFRSKEKWTYGMRANMFEKEKWT